MDKQFGRMPNKRRKPKDYDFMKGTQVEKSIAELQKEMTS